MDNNELLSQITQMFKEQTHTIESQFQTMTDDIRDIKLTIDLDVKKSIDALFDKCSSIDDRLEVIEQKLDSHREQIDENDLRILALESKTA